MSALTEAEKGALDALHPDEQEREWSLMREDRDQFQAKAERLAQENREVEGYAGRTEAALEHIITVCRTARSIETPGESALLDLFDVIACLAKVQDLRGYRRPAQPAALEELACPGCGRPMARVGGPGAHRGWACVNCNAAGDPEEDH